LPQLEAAESAILVDKAQASWIASLASASTPIGCILSGYLMDNIGRKNTLILTEIPLIIGWLLISMAGNIEMIYAGRLFTGLGAGMIGAPSRIYTSETTQPHLRGTLTALASIGVSLGILLQYIFGAYLAWKTFSAISAILPVIALVMMCFLPETPSYLVGKSKPEQAMASLARLRGSSVNVRKEIDLLQSFAVKNNNQQ
jgi:facilitated trehalose transporter